MLGHLALAGGGHRGAYGVKEKLPVMRGMMVVLPKATLNCGERERHRCVERESLTVDRESCGCGEREITGCFPSWCCFKLLTKTCNPWNAGKKNQSWSQEKLHFLAFHESRFQSFFFLSYDKLICISFVTKHHKTIFLLQSPFQRLSKLSLLISMDVAH